MIRPAGAESGTRREGRSWVGEATTKDGAEPVGCLARVEVLGFTAVEGPALPLGEIRLHHITNDTCPPSVRATGPDAPVLLHRNLLVRPREVPRELPLPRFVKDVLSDGHGEADLE